MKISEKGLYFLKKHEDCSSKVKGKNVILSQNDIACNIIVYPYYCPANKKTIGWGCMIEGDNKYDNGISVAECEKLLQERLNNEHEAYINRWIKDNITLTQNQFDALVCFCFNIPIGARAVCDLLNIGATQEQIKQKWLAYKKIKDVVNKGLEKRRIEEFEIFCK